MASLRIVHIINGECEIFLQKTHGNVRIRVSDDSGLDPNPADFELEGSIPAIRELVATLNSIMTHVDSVNEEMN